MAQQQENIPIGDAVELLKTNGFDGLAEAVTVLLNTAVVAVLMEISEDWQTADQRYVVFTDPQAIDG